MTGLGHFSNSRKTVTWLPENRGSVAVWFHLKTVVFDFKTVTALVRTPLLASEHSFCYRLNVLPTFQPTISKS